MLIWKKTVHCDRPRPSWKVFNAHIFRYMAGDHSVYTGKFHSRTHAQCCLLDEWGNRANVSAVCGHKIGWIFTAVSSHHIIVLQAPFFSSQLNRSSFNLGDSVISIPFSAAGEGAARASPLSAENTSVYLPWVHWQQLTARRTETHLLKTLIWNSVPQNNIVYWCWCAERAPHPTVPLLSVDRGADHMFYKGVSVSRSTVLILEYW